MSGLASSGFLLLVFFRTVKQNLGHFYPRDAALILVQFDVRILFTGMV
jgi:hypothetical protein